MPWRCAKQRDANSIKNTQEQIKESRDGSETCLNNYIICSMVASMPDHLLLREHPHQISSRNSYPQNLHTISDGDISVY